MSKTSRVVTSKYGWNLDSLRTQAARRSMRRGHSGGEAPLKAKNLVCVSDGWTPSLYLPSDQHQELTRETLNVDTETRRLFTTARGSRDPQDLKTVEEKIAKAVAAGRIPTPKQLASREQFRAKSQRIMSAQDRVAIIMGAKNSVVATNKEGTTWMSGGAMMVEDSGNEKIFGRTCDTTYASVSHTCPVSCAQRGVSCYGETSNNVGPIVMMLTHVANVLQRSAEEVAEDEARAIDASHSFGIFKPSDFRIHTVGDARSRYSVRTLTAAAYRWKKKSSWADTFAGKKLPPPTVWTYTHGWMEHSREDWGFVSTLASIQAPGSIRESSRRGWAPAIVVPSDLWTKRKSFDETTGEPIGFMLEGVVDHKGRDVIFLPCPAQNPDEKKAVPCTHCRLCLDDRDLHKEGFGIAFIAHSSGGVRGVPFNHPKFKEDPGFGQKVKYSDEEKAKIKAWEDKQRKIRKLP